MLTSEEEEENRTRGSLLTVCDCRPFFRSETHLVLFTHSSAGRTKFVIGKSLRASSLLGQHKPREDSTSEPREDWGEAPTPVLSQMTKKRAFSHMLKRYEL